MTRLSARDMNSTWKYKWLPNSRLSVCVVFIELKYKCTSETVDQHEKHPPLHLCRVGFLFFFFFFGQKQACSHVSLKLCTSIYLYVTNDHLQTLYLFSPSCCLHDFPSSRHKALYCQSKCRSYKIVLGSFISTGCQLSMGSNIIHRKSR